MEVLEGQPQRPQKPKSSGVYDSYTGEGYSSIDSAGPSPEIASPTLKKGPSAPQGKPKAVSRSYGSRPIKTGVQAHLEKQLKFKRFLKQLDDNSFPDTHLTLDVPKNRRYYTSTDATPKKKKGSRSPLPPSKSPLTPRSTRSNAAAASSPSSSRTAGGNVVHLLPPSPPSEPRGRLPQRSAAKAASSSPNLSSSSKTSVDPYRSLGDTSDLQSRWAANYAQLQELIRQIQEEVRERESRTADKSSPEKPLVNSNARIASLQQRIADIIRENQQIEQLLMSSGQYPSASVSDPLFQDQYAQFRGSPLTFLVPVGEGMPTLGPMQPSPPYLGPRRGSGLMLVPVYPIPPGPHGNISPPPSYSPVPPHSTRPFNSMAPLPSHSAPVMFPSKGPYMRPHAHSMPPAPSNGSKTKVKITPFMKSVPLPASSGANGASSEK